MDQKNGVDILKHLYSIQVQELMFRREREFRVFIWSSTIFVAIIGLLLVSKQTETVIWRHYGIIGKTISSIALFALVVFSISWQNRERIFAVANQRIIAKMNELLHCFDNKYFWFDTEKTLFPLKWKNWGQGDVQSISRLFRANLITATWVLGFLSIMMIWVA